MEIERNAVKASWLILAHLVMAFSTEASIDTTTTVTFQITRHNTGDIFSHINTESNTPCSEETCVGLSSGTAIGLSEKDMCTCRCHPHLPAFREDLRICVDDIHECMLAPFVGGSTSQQIPFVFLPLKGQIINPSKEIAITSGMQMPVCAVSGAKFMTENGWIELRNPTNSDVPFRLFRDDGRTFLQWIGTPDLRNKLLGRLVLVYLICKEITPDQVQNAIEDSIFSPCVAFRVVGTPSKHLTNVSEVAFVTDARIAAGTSDGDRLSVSEYVTIGICSVLLGLIYVASVFLYLHLRKRNKNSREKGHPSCSEDRSLEAAEEGIVKNNPLLSMPPHFIPSDSVYSDTNSSDNEPTPDIIKHHEDRKKQVTSAMIHCQSQKYAESYRSPFALLEHNHQEAANNEKLPEENVSIVETLEGREERPDNIRALNGNTRKKLYFNPAYFEPQLLLAPPPAALEFLSKIREVISLAKQKMISKKFTPSLLNIPEEENNYTFESTYDFAKPSRQNSILSLKRENSRRRSCTGCPGCEPQDFNSSSEKLAEVFAACHSCSVSTNESKQRSIRKWLEDVPVIRDSNSVNQEVFLKPGPCPKKLRSPTRTLSSENIGLERRNPSSRSHSFDFYLHHSTRNEKRKLPETPPQSTLPPEPENEENIYDTVPMDEKKDVLHLPPPDMIHEAMEVDKTEEKVATLTKEHMKAVINEFTVHRSLIIPQIDSPVPVKSTSTTDYETDSLERATKNKDLKSPIEYAEIVSSQPSPSLSTALPDQEEMTIRNAIFNKKTGNMTISKINMEDLQEDEHDYELIVMKKGSIIDPSSYNLPELLQRNNGYSLVSEVYVNNGFNYGSLPSTPGGSTYSTLEKKTLKVRYEEGIEKPGKLLIEVEDCPDHYIPVHESDNFEPDTLDRKPGRSKLSKSFKEDYSDSLERPHRILLRTSGSFRNDALNLKRIETEDEPSNFNRAFGSLREIYEAKAKGIRRQTEEFTVISDEEKGRILTLEDRHSKRQRAKGQVPPDVIPPPPHNTSPIYQHPKSQRKVVISGTNGIPIVHSSKNGICRSVDNCYSTASVENKIYSDVGTPDQKSEDYELCLLQKSKRNGNITRLIQTEDVLLKKGTNNQFILHSTIYVPPITRLSEDRKKTQKYTWQNTLKPEDSGYLSTDSTESRLKAKLTISEVNGACSETDESLGDGHSESGGESVETHSVFFNRYHRQPVSSGGYGSMDSGVIGGEEGHSSSDSETVSYTTVVPVTSPVKQK